VQVPLPLYGFNPDCFAAPAPPAPAITKPALSLNSDYLLAPVAYLTPPSPLDKTQSSIIYSDAGVDSGNIVIRGGAHFEYDDGPVPAIPSSLRGIDLVTGYTVAWFEKYLLHDPNADAKLLTARWRNDPTAATVDPGKDPNLYSWHYKSRLDVTLASGQRFDCENLRDGCAGQTTLAEDCGGSTIYNVVTVDTAPDVAPAPCSQ